MANIQKRGNSYRIKVSCGYDLNGNQVEQSMTWKPDKNMAEKILQEQQYAFLQHSFSASLSYFRAYFVWRRRYNCIKSAWT